MKIAIVDDDEMVCNDLIRYINAFNVKYDFDFQSESFLSCEQIYPKILNGNHYDLILLDIEFPGMNGTEFGRLLRGKLRKYDTQIIFISAVKDYAMDLFKICPIDFLIKPIKQDDLQNCLLSFITHYRKIDGFLDYVYENTKHRIKVRDVLYLKSQGKRVEIHSETCEAFSVYGKIIDLITDHEDTFICIARGLYVNTYHIIDVTTKQIKLKNGEVLCISRSKQNIVRDRLAEL